MTNQSKLRQTSLHALPKYIESEDAGRTMPLLRNVLLAILALSLLTFIALFGQLPALRKTPIGGLQRALCLHLPNTFRSLDRRITGGKLTSRTQRLGQYLFYEQNPVVLV